MEACERLDMVPAGEVLIWLAHEYEKQRLYSGRQQCLDAAIITLLDRLLSRVLVAWANEVFIDTENPEVGFSYHKILNPADILTQTKFGPVPLDFWCQFSNATSHFRSVCTVTGDFKFGFDSGSYAGWRQGRAYRVLFEQSGLTTLGYRRTLARETPSEAPAEASIPKFSDDDRAAWILAMPLMSADKAYASYKQEPGYCGTKREEFRAEWKKLQGTRQGRPPKNKSPH